VTVTGSSHSSHPGTGQAADARKQAEGHGATRAVQQASKAQYEAGNAVEMAAQAIRDAGGDPGENLHGDLGFDPEIIDTRPKAGECSYQPVFDVVVCNVREGVL
jgi:hypothetical protein